MKIVLTHENADFDALASLLAVNLLNDSLPVLPTKINANVSAFLAVFGSEMPFVKFKNLPSEEIVKITLVDTQALPGFDEFKLTIPVLCIDHQSKCKDESANWSYCIEPVGANVTILVEQIQNQDLNIPDIYATLLMLGIYEETGSFTYVETSYRDLQAAAYLLSVGANIATVNQFLYHPLTTAQHALYAELVRAAEMIQIYSENILISCTTSKEKIELALLAQRMLDSFEPDALFLLVETQTGVEFFGRSKSEQIDIGMTAKLFGGEGHYRSVTALIGGKSIGQIRSELVDCLEKIVQPAITVAQIMSHGLQTVAPELLAFAAAELFKRYGFEGFPIVQGTQLFGLLTRRAVDRAVSHHLNLSALDLMMPGNQVVYPSDSVDIVRKLMVESGWGQIPVVEPQSGKLIGIVTRTDLIRSSEWKLQPQKYKKNFADLMDTLIPSARLNLIKLVANLATELHFPIYIVGGFVRDLILGKPSLDFDIVVEGDAIELGRRLQKRFGGRLTTHDRFGTAKWFMPSGDTFIRANLTQSDLATNEDAHETLPLFLDLVSSRTEFYIEPSALPIVEKASIKLDLHRRDFTINTLALRLDGNQYGAILDYWGGYTDLEYGIVRVLHSLSFIDDPTRIMRAVRFEQRFDFKIEPKTLHLIQNALELVKKLSGDRIHHEFEHILEEAKGDKMFARLNELGVLAAIHPDLVWDEVNERLFSLIPIEPSKYLFDVAIQEISIHSWINLRSRLLLGAWLARLNIDALNAITERIHHPMSEMQHILEAKQIVLKLPILVGMLPSGIVLYLDGCSLMAVMISRCMVENVPEKVVLTAYLQQYRFVHSRFRGDDLLAAGITPGPVFKHILQSLRGGLLDGIVQTEEEETELFNLLVSQARNNG